MRILKNSLTITTLMAIFGTIPSGKCGDSSTKSSYEDMLATFKTYRNSSIIPQNPVTSFYLVNTSENLESKTADRAVFKTIALIKHTNIPYNLSECYASMNLGSKQANFTFLRQNPDGWENTETYKIITGKKNGNASKYFSKLMEMNKSRYSSNPNKTLPNKKLRSNKTYNIGQPKKNG